MFSLPTRRAAPLRLDGTAQEDVANLQEQIERLMPELRIAVIFAGNKATPGSVVYQTSNTRSWKSYEAVAQNIAASLERLGFRHVQLLPEDMHLGDRLRRNRIHLAWLNSGGVQGYNAAGHASAMLEMLGVPYVGHNPLTASILDNKHAFKAEAIAAGLPTAPFFTWSMARGVLRPEINSRFQRAFGDYPGPFVVKPVSGRASLHVHVVEDRASLPDVVRDVYHATENIVLVEQYLSGREFCIAVAGRLTSHGRRLVRGRDPFTFAALERVLASEEKIFTSMDLRPITNDRFRPVDAPEDAELLKRMRRLACEVFLEFNLQSLVRLDLRADHDGNLYILEANPKPDLKRPEEGVTSLIGAGLPEVGMDYDDLVYSLLADRLDFLFTHRRGSVGHILDLLETHRSAAPRLRPSVSAAEGRDVQPLAASAEKLGDMAAIVNKLAADLNVLALKSVLDTAPADGENKVAQTKPGASKGGRAA